MADVRPKFTVAIAMYNAERYIGQCISSIMDQTYQDFELIVVDDGSTDGSASIVRKYCSFHPQVKLVTKGNSGCLMARVTALEAANGDYVLFVDADDGLVPEALERISSVIDGSGPDVVAFSHFRTVRSKPEPTRHSLDAGLHEGDGIDQVRKAFCLGGLNSVWSRAVRRSCLSDLGFYRQHQGLMHGEDIVVSLPVFDKMKSFYLIDDALYFYRPNEASGSYHYADAQLVDITRATNQLKNYAQNWSASCVEAAEQGTILQVCHLLKIFALDVSKGESKRVSLARIGRLIREKDMLGVADPALIRLDNRLLLLGAAKNSQISVRLVARIVLSGKVLAREGRRQLVRFGSMLEKRSLKRLGVRRSGAKS